ncbi:hypothetical protein MVLG_06223 [Microbotryum lychnidis-dioicae p1A1 Lamole]|uniref:Peptidase A1 domain-containing protein n=1 Tax=Microbotryum lychnidis-dioicae (strain p1A1 Lamole / MvSl-1064) TaxID=683840 RepID=U5HGL8_USTV1|nr:hypothetical protein MVLG_06223 [Microbotryum lychnidis-dioicae p1A1 Lamole]|eukprot:KDE03293.1 hypothetical protein MVLG_06223 [Microbotryum lychnidis-dioicae p1A1 Lamole]
MRVPSALFALLPLLGQLTQAHHDAAPRHHQPRSFKLEVRTPQRSDLLRLDGTMNVELVKRAVKQHHQRRQAQAVAATRDQTAHLNVLKRAQETEDMFHAKKARVMGRALKTGAAPVKPHADGSWSGTVGLGPGGSQKILNLMLDTDGPRLDIFAKGSPTKCNTTYDPTKSPHAIKGASFTSRDGIARGDYYQDSVTFGGLEVANQFFRVFTNTSNGMSLEDHLLLLDEACGFLGLGFNTIQPTLVQTLISSHAIARPFFAVALNNKGGSVDIGTVDTRAYKGHVAWAPLAYGAKSTSWTIKTPAFTKDKQPVANSSNLTVSFQTYFSFTMIPPWFGHQLFDDIGGSVDKENFNFYRVRCDEIKKRTFGFIIGGQTMEVPLSSINIGPYDNDTSKCSLAIIPAPDTLDEITFGTLALEVGTSALI